MADVTNPAAGAVVVPPAGGELPTDIRGLKPPLEIASGWGWLGWVAVLVVLVVLGWLILRWWRRRAQPDLAVPVMPPHVRARQRLDAALSHLSDPKEFCILVSDTIRVYLEERFHFHAPDRTTEEFLAELQGTERLNAGQKESLGLFLQQCDLVKFARFEPTETALRELHDAACRLVDETRFEPEPTRPVASQPAASAPSTP